jgi:hypothetical protein
VSDAHAEGDGHSPVGHVALIVGPGDRRTAKRYAALLDRIDAGWSRGGDRIPAERTVKSSVAGEVE